MASETPGAEMPSIVRRYKIGYASDAWGERSSTPSGIPDAAGPWVRYEDHLAALSAAAPAAPAIAAWRTARANIYTGEIERGDWIDGAPSDDMMLDLRTNAPSIALEYAYAAPQAQQTGAVVPAGSNLEKAWRDGWAACRDAEHVGREAEDEAWGASEINGLAIDIEQSEHAQIQQPGAAEVEGRVTTDMLATLQSGLSMLREINAKSEARHERWAQQHPDDAAVDHFAAAMKAKLAAARAKGRSGWDDPAQCTADALAIDLRKHVNKGDPVDVANFAMFLHARGESTKLRPLSGDLIDAIKAAPAGTSAIEHGGAVVFVSREGDHSAPTLLLGEMNHRELNAEVTQVNYLAGEIFLRVTGGREVPQDLAAGAAVDILYQAEEDGEQKGSAA